MSEFWKLFWNITPYVFTLQTIYKPSLKYGTTLFWLSRGFDKVVVVHRLMNSHKTNRYGQVKTSSNRSEHVNNVNYSPAKRKPKRLHFNPAFRCTRLLPEIIKFWRIVRVEFLGKEKYCILDWKQSWTDSEFEVHLNIKDNERGNWIHLNDKKNCPQWPSDGQIGNGFLIV